MSREADIERAGNLLAGSLAVFWLARGALVLNGQYRDAFADLLIEGGLGHHAVSHVLAAVSLIFVGLAIALVLRAAERWVQVAQIGVVAAATVLLVAAVPSSLGAAFGPLPKGLVPAGLAWVLFGLAAPQQSFPRLERRLRVVLAIFWTLSGLASLALPAGELAAVEAVGILTVDPLAFVVTAGLVQLLTGLATLLVPFGGAPIRALIYVQVAQLCIVPAVLFGVGGADLYQPLAPLLKNIPLLGAAATLLWLGRLDDVEFFGRLRLAERSDRVAAILYRLQAIRFGEPFASLAHEQRSLSEGVGRLLRASDPLVRVQNVATDVAAYAFGTVMILLPRRLNVALDAALGRWTIRRFEDCLRLLPEQSLTRRAVRDFMETEARHLRRLRDAA